MRTLDADTITALKGWSKHHAAMFIEDKQDGEVVTRQKDGAPITVRRFSRDWIMLQFYNFTYKDEFEFIREDFKRHLGPDALADYEARLATLPPRTDEVFARLLDEKRPAGFTPKEA